MLLSRRPLTSYDEELFVDREDEIRRIERTVSLGSNVLIVGPSGSGKTSLLRRLQGRSRDAGGEWVYVDCSPWEEFEHVLAAIAAGLGGDTRNRPLYLDPADHREDSLVGRIRVDRPPIVTETDVADMASVGSAARVVMVDGLAPEHAFDLFGRFRDTLWQFPHRWIVTAEPVHLGDVLRPPATAFFETVVELAEMPPAQLQELLDRRARELSDAEDVDRLRRVAAFMGAEGQPPHQPGSAIAIALSSLSTDQADVDHLLSLHFTNIDRADGIGDSAGEVFRALLELGRVHAGDERLLRRAGLSRARVVQLLKQLEEARLVRSMREGRKVLYAVKEPLDQ